VTVSTTRRAVVTTPTDTQIVISREFDAPRHLVYKACTTPELVKQWWGGDRGEVTSAEIDLRPGGKWRYVMQANGGFEVAFHGEYREILTNQRIVSTEIYEGAPDPEVNGTLNTMTLEDKGGLTLLTTAVQTPNKFVRDAIIESGMEGGMQESFDHLEKVAQSLR